MSRATAIAIFETLGFTVFDAYNGHHALALLEARPEISLLFVDVRMPGMSGPELAAVVRQRRPDIKVVLTSGRRAAEKEGGLGARPLEVRWRGHLPAARSVGVRSSVSFT